MMLTSSQWPGALTFISKSHVSMFLCFRLIVGSSPFGKEVSHESPYPSEIITAFEPSSPSEFPMIFHGGWGEGGMDIFWNHSIKVDDRSG